MIWMAVVAIIVVALALCVDGLAIAIEDNGRAG